MDIATQLGANTGIIKETCLFRRLQCGYPQSFPEPCPESGRLIQIRIDAEKTGVLIAIRLESRDDIRSISIELSVGRKPWSTARRASNPR